MLETEEKESEQQRRLRKARAAAAAAPWGKAAGKLNRTKSCIELIGGKTETINSQEEESSSGSSSLLLLLGGGKPADCKDKARLDRRCDSVGDRGTSFSRCGLMGKPIYMPAKPKPEPIEIRIDLERILPPVEGAVFTTAVNTV